MNLITITTELTRMEVARLVNGAETAKVTRSKRPWGYVCAGNQQQYAPAYGDENVHAAVKRIQDVIGRPVEYTITEESR